MRASVLLIVLPWALPAHAGEVEAYLRDLKPSFADRSATLSELEQRGIDEASDLLPHLEVGGPTSGKALWAMSLFEWPPHLTEYLAEWWLTSDQSGAGRRVLHRQPFEEAIAQAWQAVKGWDSLHVNAEVALWAAGVAPSRRRRLRHRPESQARDLAQLRGLLEHAFGAIARYIEDGRLSCDEVLRSDTVLFVLERSEIAPDGLALLETAADVEAVALRSGDSHVAGLATVAFVQLAARRPEEARRVMPNLVRRLTELELEFLAVQAAVAERGVETTAVTDALVEATPDRAPWIRRLREARDLDARDAGWGWLGTEQRAILDAYRDGEAAWRRDSVRTRASPSRIE